jgi:hypothetical protein
MKHRRANAGLENFIAEMRARQNNIVWPNPLVNSRNVDAFLWKGSPNPSLIQRTGAWLIGLVYVGLALVCLVIARSTGKRWMAVLIVGLLFLGVKIFANGCRGHGLKPTEEASDRPGAEHNKAPER